MENSQFLAPELAVDMSWQWRDDPWLADCLGLPVRGLLPPAQDANFPPLPSGLDNAFVYSKLPVGHLRSLVALTAVGFQLVDTAITLERRCQPHTFCPLHTTMTISEARPEHCQPVTALARHAYSLTRFHQDPYISRNVADDIQARWAANFFLGKRGDFMLVAEKDGTVQGFLLALTPDSHTVVVDLIAVAPQAQRQGVGKALINAAQAHCQRPVARTGTQLANTGSLSFYQKMGFTLCQAAHTLHKHPPCDKNRTRFFPIVPPRVYAVGVEHPISISDCGRIELAPDEQVTLVTPNGGQYDITRKDWGFYATPSTNGRLASFGLRAALVRNRQNKYFVLLVEKTQEGNMLAYIEQEHMNILCWLDSDEAVESLVGREHARRR